jgi:hypothetical protein
MSVQTLPGTQPPSIRIRTWLVAAQVLRPPRAVSRFTNAKRSEPSPLITVGVPSTWVPAPAGNTFLARRACGASGRG